MQMINIWRVYPVYSQTILLLQLYPGKISYAFFREKNNHYQEISDKINHRTNSYKTHKEILLPKPDTVIPLLQKALATSIHVDYILRDILYITEPILERIPKTDLDVIGMVRQLKQLYYYHGKAYTLPELRKLSV